MVALERKFRGVRAGTPDPVRIVRPWSNMTNADIAGIAGLIVLVPLIIDNALDFLVPGRWERRAYKRSLEDFEREIRRRDRKK